MSEPELRMAAAIGTMTLLCTLGGSALLALVFGWSGGRSIPILARYGLIIVTGGGAGGAMMMPFGTPKFMLAGVTYGLVTALGWIALHRAIYRGQ